MRGQHGDLSDRGQRYGATTWHRELDTERAGGAAQRAVDERAEAPAEVVLVDGAEEVDGAVVHIAADMERGAHAAQVVSDLGIGDRADLDVSHEQCSTLGGGLRTARWMQRWRR